jgi:cellulose synthase/poly-beta-1,6-N-acetylglucosamine synthase-like glycosyltransferase
MSHYADKYNRSLKSVNTAHGNVDDYQEKSKKVRREQEAFLNREFDYRDYIFAPEGYEGIMLFLYIMIIPYLVALVFLFLFIAKAHYQLFLEFNLASFLIIWAIGYEICAILAIIIFFYSWFSDDSSDDTPKISASKHNGIHPRFRN